MKEKILSLAQGKFRYQQPKLQLSLNRLILQVEEGGESSEQLVISNDEGTKVKGFGASEDIHFDFFPVFDGKENHVTVRVKAGNRKAGEVLTGVLYLVTDCGEQTLPYEVRIVKSYLKDSMGQLISGYPEFVHFAKENFEEAVRIFYHQKFLDRYLETLEDKRLYRHLTKKNSKKEALKEFLVTHGDMEKEPVPEKKRWKYQRPRQRKLKSLPERDFEKETMETADNRPSSLYYEQQPSGSVDRGIACLLSDGLCAGRLSRIFEKGRRRKAEISQSGGRSDRTGRGGIDGTGASLSDHPVYQM